MHITAFYYLQAYQKQLKKTCKNANFAILFNPSLHGLFYLLHLNAKGYIWP
jgi:hypothetical protein